MNIEMKPIGYIRSPFKERRDLKHSSYDDGSLRAEIIMEEGFQEGIADIKPGDYGVILFYFHQSDGYTLTTVSRKYGKEMGVFSTRSPNRPNGIGMSIVRFTNKSGKCLEFTGIDMLDRTPVLDIKPYDGERLPMG
jgi:tRNA-Thr(GGU) m(6)t(6)A37 methyltransferase TsaA